MQFDKDKIDAFLKIFDSVKTNIREFEGCNGLTLFQDINDNTILFTYSYWESKDALEAYRHSTLFKSTWANTISLFADKAKAWSVRELRVLN